MPSGKAKSNIYFPGKIAFLFSKNAVVPSLKSSVPKQVPKFSISTKYQFVPSSKFALIACMAFAIATLELLQIFAAIPLANSNNSSCATT